MLEITIQLLYNQSPMPIAHPHVVRGVAFDVIYLLPAPSAVNRTAVLASSTRCHGRANQIPLTFEGEFHR